jgi:hypothetical protein
MSLQSIERDKDFGPSWLKNRNRFPITETVNGTGSRLLYGYTGTVVDLNIDDAAQWISNTAGPVFATLESTTTTTIGEYDSDFVASVLRADAEAPEASFNNVVDMLDWLNRD